MSFARASNCPEKSSTISTISVVKVVATKIGTKPLPAFVRSYTTVSYTHLDVYKRQVYEVLLSYWYEVMSDDVYLVSVDGYGAARTWENIMGEYTSGKKKGQERVIGWEGVLLPRALIESCLLYTSRCV